MIWFLWPRDRLRWAMLIVESLFSELYSEFCVKQLFYIFIFIISLISKLHWVSLMLVIIMSLNNLSSFKLYWSQLDIVFLIFNKTYSTFTFFPFFHSTLYKLNFIFHYFKINRFKDFPCFTNFVCSFLGLDFNILQNFNEI